MTPADLYPLANHLWQSTLFATVAGILVLVLRNNPARIRFQIWLAASIKFLMPFSILVAAGGHLGWHTTDVATRSGVSTVVERISVPFAESVPTLAMLDARPSIHWIPAGLTVIWACGMLWLCGSWWLRWRRLRSALRAASPVHLPIHLRATTSPAFREPGVFGIWRPILLLPEGIIERLTQTQLDSVLRHELCHVHRRDNLATAIHMVVEAVFWFQPMVWWLGARLMEERERACDEEVLRMGSDPQTYAESILRICELSLEPPLPCVAGVTGGNLKRRIEAIMTNQAVRRLNFTRRLLVTVAAVLAVFIPIVIGIATSPSIVAQTSVPQWQTAAGGKMEFEVASIRQNLSGKFTSPNFPLDPGNAYATTGGRFSADFGVITYITFAYKLSLTQEQRQAMIASLPKWVANDRFTIQAKAASGNPTKDQMRLMMQSLLADRFQLAIHFESQQVPVLAMALVHPGKTGPKLKPHSEGLPCDSPAPEPARGSQDPPEVFPNKCEITAFVRRPAGNLAGSRNTTLELIADALPSLGGLDRPVVDRTGLSGMYDFRLEWIPDPNASAPHPDVQPDPQGPSFLQALREQLGVKLESTKAAVRTPIIERVERPSEN